MTPRAVPRGDARAALLDAAMAVIRAKGLSATSVDDLCAAAGVSKGAFFHHFPSKEALAVAAAEHWSTTTAAMFAAAPYHDLDDPLDRVLAYVDLREALIQGTPAEFGCLAGTMVQESFATAPAVRDACGRSIFGHAATLEEDLASAIERHPPAFEVDAGSLARHTQAVLQGAFILAKAADDPSVAVESVEHLRRYLRLLFPSHQPGKETPPMTDRPTLPEGMHQLSPHLVCRDAAAAVDFYVKAFDATERLRLHGPDGKIMHAFLVVNGSSVLLVDEQLEWGLRSPLDLGGSPVTIHLVVPDADAVFAKAVAAGATPHMPVAEQFWGDRYGVLGDPFGHLWSVATPQSTKTVEELTEAARSQGST